MSADASDSIRGFRFTLESSASPAPSSLEDDVVSLYEQLRAPVLRYLLSFRIPVPGLRYREIAEVLGISLGSVAATLEKSLSRLTRAEQSEGTL